MKRVVSPVNMAKLRTISSGEMSGVAGMSSSIRVTRLRADIESLGNCGKEMYCRRTCRRSGADPAENLLGMTGAGVERPIDLRSRCFSAGNDFRKAVVTFLISGVSARIMIR
jgi:hypothetical protein